MLKGVLLDIEQTLAVYFSLVREKSMYSQGQNVLNFFLLMAGLPLSEFPQRYQFQFHPKESRQCRDNFWATFTSALCLLFILISLAAFGFHFSFLFPRAVFVATAARASFCEFKDCEIRVHYFFNFPSTKWTCKPTDIHCISALFTVTHCAPH